MAQNKNESREEYQYYWDIVENSLNEGSMSGYKMAVVETEKILNMAFDEKKIPGKSTEDKIRISDMILQNPEKLKYSRAMYKKIIKEPGFDISQNDTKDIIAGYFKAISDIVDMENAGISTKEKIRLFLEKYFNYFPNTIKNIAILLVLFFVLVFLLTETQQGIYASDAVINLTRFIFYKILPMIFTAVLFISLIVGILYYWQRKKKK
jgi:hypothetical protein